MTLTAPLQLSLFTAADVVVDEPTAQQAMRLMADLRDICVGDVWQSGEYRVERDDVTGCDTVRFLRGAHVRGEWVVGDDDGETSPNRLAAALKAIHAELVGTGITTGWLREGLLCEDADEGCENLCYDAFEKFNQEALWRTQVETCTSSADTLPSSATTRLFLAANMSSVTLTGWRRSWTLPAMSNSGAKSGASSQIRSTRSTSGAMFAGTRAQKLTSAPTRRGSMACTPSVKSAATSTGARIMPPSGRRKARVFGSTGGANLTNRK